DAVPDHRHRLSGLLQLGDLLRLVPGQDLGDDGVDAELVGDAQGGGLVVAGQHDDLDPGLVQGGDGCGSGVPGGVGQGDHADRTTVDGDQHRGASGRGQLVPARGQVTEVDVLGAHEAQVARQDPASVDGGGGA